MRKESILRLSDESFVKHDYVKPDKKKTKRMNDYDPQPLEFWGTASQHLPELLHKIKVEQLGISFYQILNFSVKIKFKWMSPQNIT